jgi:hypothetical protein
MLRYVSATSATIWVETDQRCEMEVLGRSVTTFCVAGHHYALAIIEDLQPDSSVEYDVKLDGVVCWPPPGTTLPPSRIRTLGNRSTSRVVFGSCRTAAPHEAPWTLQLEADSRGRGVDALYVYALSMIDHPAEEWPDLAVFLGDQIYADDSSPKARERITGVRAATENTDPDLVPPPELVGGFEEYTWLYHESWSPQMERWFFSNVPSVMIFDDHEVIDDWNISDAWVRDIHQKGWWRDHILGGLMTYWLYQHLGNLSPELIRSEGLLESLGQVDDATQPLRDWAIQSEEFTSGTGNYHFNFIRDIGRVRLVMIDSRNSRVLEPGQRRMVTAAEWKWVADSCDADVDHLLIGTSLPVFVPVGLHDLQIWSEAICDGAWGRPGRRFGEWLRIKADLEDWAAFSRSFDSFVELLSDLADSSRRQNAPATISVLSGDIHFAFASEIRFPSGHHTASRVHQLVASPIRNALTGPERTAMRLGASRLVRVLGRLLRRSTHRRRPTVLWDTDLGPVFANSLSQVSFDGRSARLLVLQSRPHVENVRPEFDRVIECDLVAGARFDSR